MKKINLHLAVRVKYKKHTHTELEALNKAKKRENQLILSFYKNDCKEGSYEEAQTIQC